jgi:hypothetical protein
VDHLRHTVRKSGRLATQENFISDDAEASIVELSSQLAEFRFEVKPPVHGAVAKGTWSGKGVGKQDDIVMCLGIALFYMYNAIWRDAQFLDFCSRKGISPD